MEWIMQQRQQSGHSVVYLYGQNVPEVVQSMHKMTISQKCLH